MEKRRAYMDAYREKNREALRKKDRDRMAEYRKTEAYKEWKASGGADLMRSLKEKYRRQAGVRKMDDIQAESRQKAAAKAAIRDAARAAIQAEKERFVGPLFPTSSENPAAYYRIRYASDEKFREKEKARVAAKKQTVPMYYAKQMLGIKGAVPLVLVEAKRLQLIIKKTLRSIKNEECE